MVPPPFSSPTYSGQLVCSPETDSSFFFFFSFIGSYLIYNVELVTGVQQSDSLVHTYIFILFQILYPCKLS